MNVVEPILFQCQLNPLTTAVCVPGARIESVTYGHLGGFINNVARNALKFGIVRRNLVGIFVSDNVLHLALVLGLMRMGAATISLHSGKEIPGIKLDLILTDRPGMFSGESTVLNVDIEWLDGDGRLPDQLKEFRGGGEELCRVILTSGSTGVPKGIAFSHKLLADRIAFYAYFKGPRFAHCSRFFCDLGISTSPGFRYAMSLLSRGGTIYFLGPDPADILQIINLHKIQGMATSPYGLAEFMKYFEADSAFDLTFDHIICQGAMLSRELMHRAQARMCQNLYSSYGSTETTTIAFGPAHVTAATAGAVGYVQPGALVEVVDKSGELLPRGVDGSLRIRSDLMVHQYVGDPDATRTFFRDGYFYCGDIGRVTEDGLLVITGREKAALNIGGATVSPESIENLITSFPNIREAGVFAQNSDLGIAELYALIVPTASIDESALRDHCVRTLPPSCGTIRFITVDKLPRGGQGKLERHRFAELAAAKRSSS